MQTNHSTPLISGMKVLLCLSKQILFVIKIYFFLFKIIYRFFFMIFFTIKLNNKAVAFLFLIESINIS